MPPWLSEVLLSTELLLSITMAPVALRQDAAAFVARGVAGDAAVRQRDHLVGSINAAAATAAGMCWVRAVAGDGAVGERGSSRVDAAPVPPLALPTTALLSLTVEPVTITHARRIDAAAVAAAAGISCGHVVLDDGIRYLQKVADIVNEDAAAIGNGNGALESSNRPKSRPWESSSWPGKFQRRGCSPRRR